MHIRWKFRSRQRI